MANFANATLRWPVHGRSTIIQALRAPLADRNFQTHYRGPNHAMHLHDYHGRMRLGQAERVLIPGTVTMTPAMVDSYYHLPAPGHHDCIHFQPIPLRGACVTIPLHMPLGEEQQYVRQQMQQITALWRAAGQGPAVSTMLQALLLWLAQRVETGQAVEGQSARVQQAVQAAAELMEQRLDEPITVPQIAAAVGLSQNYLALHFRKRFGMTLPRYLLTRRMAVAQDLLRRTGLPVSRIARRVGMADAQHFNKQFRRIVGASPTAYRSQ